MKQIQRIWLISLFIKFVIALVLPLSNDEAYYWVWSHNLQLSYYDHPAMVAWLFKLGQWLEPFGNAVRFPGVFIGHLSLLFWFAIIQKHFDTERIKSWLWLIFASPLLGFGSVIVTPDLPMIFFWSASVYFFMQALETQKTKDYALLGAALGLGFCSKYLIVIFIPVILLYLTCEKKWRHVDFKKIMILILVGLICSSPVIVWNVQNEFASFKFQLAHGLKRPEYRFEWTWGYVLGQIALLFPLVFWKALKARLTPAVKFIFYAAWVPLFFFFFTSFRALVEANWPIMAYPGFFFLVITLANHRGISTRTAWGWGVLYTLVLIGLFLPNISWNEKIKEPFVFDPLVPLIHEYRPLYASTYQMASTLWYQSKEPVYKLPRMNRWDFYDTLPDAEPTTSTFYLVAYTDDYYQWMSEKGWSIKEIKKIDSLFVLLEIKRP